MEAIEKYSFLHGSKENSNKSTSQRLALSSLENLSNVTARSGDSFVAHVKKTDHVTPIEFKPDEIQGRSTALQRNNIQETFSKTAESFMNSKIHSSSFLGRPSVDQMFATSICGSLEYNDSDFQPADLMSSRMQRDEISYYEKYAPIPPDKKNKHESTFDATFNRSIGDFFVNENSLFQNLPSAAKSESSPFALASLTINNSGK